MTHKSHRHILPLIAAALCLMLAACRPASPYRAALDTADSLMEIRPDSALSLLRAIPSERITDRATRARHAMLHAMARDKNYIDDTTFTILQPAIDYYENHGSPTEKLRTFYYQGRIYENDHETTSAMVSYQKALDVCPETDDTLTKARLCYAVAGIYRDLNKHKKAIQSYSKAANLFQAAHRFNSYANCVLNIANLYTILDNGDSTWKYLRKCRNVWSKISTEPKYSYYAYHLIATYSFHENDKKAIRRAIQSYVTFCPPSQWDYTSLAIAYLQVKEYDKALYYVSKLPFTQNIQTDIRHYLLLGDIYTGKGMYKEANRAFLHYVELCDSVYERLYEKDAQFVEERHHLQSQAQKEKREKILIVTTSMSCLVLLLVIIIQGYTKFKKHTRQKAAAEQEAREYAARHSRMSEEMQTLRQNLKESQALNRTAKVLMAQRLALLNELIADKSGKHSPVQNALTDMLSKPETFIQSARQTLSITHPRFIRTLQQHNLTDEEIGLCCLYALGLNTKQAGIYAKTTRAYHANSAIRQKLQLDTHVTNLNLYIARMLQQEEEKTTAKGGEI